MRIRSCLRLLYISVLTLACAACGSRTEQKVTHVDQARLRELELAEKVYADQRTAERVRLETDRALEEKKIAVEKERLATARIGEERRFEAERAAGQERRAAARRALDAEIRRLAATSNRFDVLVAELRSRQGRLQLKLASLPSDIEGAEKDFGAVDAIMIGCMQTVVTNVRQRAGIFTTATIPVETVVERKSLDPYEYVNALNNNPDLNRILSGYDSRMVKHALNKIAENFSYEEDRFNREMDAIRSGQGRFRGAQRDAFSSGNRTLGELKGRLRSVERAIREKGPASDPELAALRSEQRGLETQISLAENQSQFARAADLGVTGSFRSQEVSVENEREANLRAAINDARTTVLTVVDAHRRELVRELEHAKEELAAINLVLEAYTKGALTLDQKMSLLGSVEAKHSRDLDNAASVLWSDNDNGSRDGL